MQIEGYRIHHWGGDLHWEVFTIPAPGPGEALVRVEACGIGLTVLNCIRGDLGNDPAMLPRVPGHELVGRVEAVGEGVSTLTPGQRVMAYFYLACDVCSLCRAGQHSLCQNLKGQVGVHCDGGYAPYVVLPARNLLPVPESIPAAIATAIPDAIATPLHVCKSRAQIKPGDRVVVIGAGGGVGIHMVQMARLFGAEVAGLEISEKKFPAIEQAGGKPVLSHSFADLNVAALWAGQKPTVVIDLVGRAESLSWGLAALATSGRLVVLTTFRQVTFPADPRELVLREISLLGSRYASKADLLEAAELVASGRLKPVVTQIASPQEVIQVHSELQAGSLIGRGAVIWPH